MELLTLTVSVLLAMSFLSAPCASDQLNLNKQDDHAMFAQPLLPRKLMNLNHEIAKSASSEGDLAVHGEFPQASSGTKQHEKEENFINAKEEDDDEEEGSNKSEYFTMDYRWVRRRRPIHNKQIPFVP
ncbi:protein GOLVEN 6-like [Salvia hispanica]|uniref:protein GOLVEN 6-like n=1 Tax=Salvia hispanica TaxID=49212 RepID=UPI0020097924|nr:protein GOLVEN 6-like [Salvia hispanica]